MKRELIGAAIYLFGVVTAAWTIAEVRAAVIIEEPFGLLVACKKGGVSPRGETHLASGWTCVGKDASGSKFSTAALSVYDDEGAVP